MSTWSATRRGESLGTRGATCASWIDNQMFKPREEIERFLAQTERRELDRELTLLGLLTGCALCGRRLIEAGSIVREGTVLLDVLDDQTGELIARYPVCREHAPCKTGKP